MTYAAVVAWVTVLYVLWLLRETQAAFAVERRELLNRIQRPEVVPLAPAAEFREPEPEPDDSALVGSIVYEPEE